MKKKLVNLKPSVGYESEIKGNTLILKTTGERRFIHHRNAFSNLKVRLPKAITFQYEHLPLKTS